MLNAKLFHEVLRQLRIHGWIDKIGYLSVDENICYSYYDVTDLGKEHLQLNSEDILNNDIIELFKNAVKVAIQTVKK